MRVSRFRFTVRGMMIVVAVVGVLMVVEIKIARWAINVVSEGDGRGGTVYIRNEAIGVWMVANIAFALSSFLIGGPLFLALSSLREASLRDAGFNSIHPDPPEPDSR